MKVYNPTSKIMTDYQDSELTRKEIIAKRRLEVALNAYGKMLALKTFANSKVFYLKN